jgi:YD repeat-containing protein
MTFYGYDLDGNLAQITDADNRNTLINMTC